MPDKQQPAQRDAQPQRPPRGLTADDRTAYGSPRPDTAPRAGVRKRHVQFAPLASYPLVVSRTTTRMLAGLAVALSLTSCSTGQNAEAVEPKRPSALADGAVCADWLRARSDVREQYASWRLTEFRSLDGLSNRNLP